MSTLSGTDLPKPTGWEDFERKICVLMRCVLGDPNTQQNGRQGQAQNGVDVYGYRKNDKTCLVGVQCKKKFEKAVTEKELEEEVTKALKFKPTVSEFILATTAPRDQAIQETARLITERLGKTQHAITVVVWGWEDIRDAASDHGDAWKAFDPTFHPFAEEQHIEVLAAVKETERNILEALEAVRPSTSLVQVEKSNRDDTEIFGLIKAYEGLIDDGNATIAVTKLEKLKEDKWAAATEAERYRLMASMAKARLQLGAQKIAGDLLLRAVDAFPQHPKASLTRAKGHFLQRDLKAALNASEKILGDEELGDEAAGIAIQCRYELGQAARALDGVSEKSLATPIVASAVILGKRIVDDGSWVNEAIEAVRSHAADHYIKWFAADAHLEAALKSGSDFDPQSTLDENARKHLAEAEKLYGNLLDDAQYQEFLPAELANNAALMFRLVGKIDKARDVLDRGLKSEKADQHLLLQRAALARNDNDFGSVLAILPEQSSSAEINILKAEALAAQGRRDEALALIDTVDLDVLSLGPRLSALAAKAKCLCDKGDAQGAKNLAVNLMDSNPDNPGYLALGLKVYRVTEGDEQARAILEQRIAGVRKDAEIGGALELAYEAFSLKHYKAVVDLLDGRISLDRISDALMLILSASINGNLTKKAHDILEALPADVATEPTVLRARTAYMFKVGHPKAADVVAQYLKVRPYDLDMTLARVGMLQRGGTKEQSADFVKSLDPTKFGAAPPVQLMGLAQAFVQFGRPVDGVRLGYETLLDNWNDAIVHLRYQGLLLANDATADLVLHLDAVAYECVVKIENDRGESHNYRLEREKPRAFAADHVAEGSDIANLLLGKKIDETVELGGGNGSRLWKVVSIKHPWLDALHRSLEEFNARFPRSNGLMRYEVDFEKEEPLEPMKEVLKASAERDKRALDYYRDHTVPFLFIASFIGRDPIEAWLGLIAEGRDFRVSLGAHAERNAAIDFLKKRERKGCVLDPITLVAVRRLGIEDAVRAVCGPLKVTQSVLDVLIIRAEEARRSVGRKQGFMSYHNGSIQITALTPEQLLADLKIRDDELEWAKAATEIVPAIPASDLSGEQLALTDLMEEYAWEPVVAAQGQGLMLLTEDMPLRGWASSSFKVGTSWLQPVLMAAREEDSISHDAYTEAIATLAQCHHYHTSVSPAEIVHQFRKDDYEVTEALRAIIWMTTGPMADLTTNIPILMKAIIMADQAVKAAGAERSKVCRLAGDIFTALVVGRADKQTPMVWATARTGPEWLRRYAIDWLVGHSIGTPDFPKLIEIQRRLSA